MQGLLQRQRRRRRRLKPKANLLLIISCCVGISYIHFSGAAIQQQYAATAFTHFNHPITITASLQQESSSKSLSHKRRYAKKIKQHVSHRLFVRPSQQRYSDDGTGSELEREFTPLFERRQYTERPTQTSTEAIRSPAFPAKPKIVVFGASGLIGRSVVRQLLDHPQLNDGTIVAFVRDYDKACRVLYDDMIVASSRRQKGAKLLIVQGDLVPPEELPNYRIRNDAKIELELDAADADKNSRHLSVIDESKEKSVSFYDDEILQDAIKDCTAIISCVGTCRITNLWTDYIVRPFYRVLRSNVSDWCYDRHHPYYVHYRTIQKIIHYAEQEQLRRQTASLPVADDADTSKINVVNNSNPQKHLPNTNKRSIPRIRLVRISDLCVAQPPWYFIPLLVNIFHSMIFRYHYMADQLLERSIYLDTISIRPGDVVDEERDSTYTSIQMSPTGMVPYPARISRDDTAEVIVAAALWNNNNHNPDRVNQSKLLRSFHSINVNDKSIVNDKSFHYTFACRWVGGNTMDPYPTQGHKSDGHPTAYECILSTIGGRSSSSSSSSSNFSPSHQGIHKDQQLQPRTTTKIKPYGICAAIPVYWFLSVLISSLIYNCVGGKSGGLALVGKAPSWLLGKPIVAYPPVSLLKTVFTTITTFVVGSLQYLQWIVNVRSCRNVKYISF